ALIAFSRIGSLKPVIMTMRACGLIRLIARKLSTPFMTGMRTSMKVMSKSSERACSSASCPSFAISTAWPWTLNRSARVSARSWSSSTIMMRTLLVTMGRPLRSLGCCQHRGGRLEVRLSRLPRQPDREHRALTLLALDIDRAAMLLDQLADRRQTEPDAFRLGREQRLEDLAQLVGRDARAAIGDRQADLWPGRLGAAGDRPAASGGRLPLRVHHCLRGVVDQVHQDLPEARAVEHDGGIGGKFAAHGDGRVHLVLVQHLAQPGVDRGRFAV